MGCLLAQAERLLQHWNTFWPKRRVYSNVGIPSGPSGLLIPTLVYLLAHTGRLLQRWSKRVAYSNSGLLLAQAGRSFQRWNTFWPKRRAYCNAGMPSSPSGTLIPTLEIHSTPSRALVPTLEYFLAQAKRSFSNVGILYGPSGTRGNTFWPKQGSFQRWGCLLA